MVSSAQTLQLGAWESERIQIATAPLSNHGDVDDLPDDLRFQVHISRLIRKRECRSDAETSGAAAFILVTPEEQRALISGRNFDRLIHTGTRRLANRLHFVTAQASSSALEEHLGDDNDLFDRIASLGYDARPAIIYVPNQDSSSLSYYPKGTGTDEGIREIVLSFGQVSESEIIATLDAIYRSELCTPDNTGPVKIWENVDKGYPIEDAERTVQQIIRSALVGRFLWCTIRQEQAGKIGRTDLEIVDDRTGSAGAIYHHALLELKVLRSFGATGRVYSPAQVEGVVAEGVNQAKSYGDANNSVVRMLCCFDMRTMDHGDDATFLHVRDNAEILCVRLKRWYLYRSSQDYRNAIVDRQLTVAVENGTGSQ